MEGDLSDISEDLEAYWGSKAEEMDAEGQEVDDEIRHEKSTTHNN